MSYLVDYGVLLNDRLKKIYPVVATKVREEYLDYCNPVKDNKYQYMMQGLTGLAEGEIIVDGQIPSSDNPLQGFNKTFTQAVFTKRIRMSQQSRYYMFNAKNPNAVDSEIEKKVLALKDSITHLKNRYAQSLLAQGASTSFTFSPIGFIGNSVTVDTTGADGVAYWSASHPREDGGTVWTNIITSTAAVVNPPLSISNVMQARAIHSAKKDGRGLPLMSTLDTMVVLKDSQNHFLAQSIKRTIESGKYPSASPSVSGSFVDAAPTDTFNIVALANYGTTGLTSLQWMMFDSKMKTDDFGFQFVTSMDLSILPFMQDFTGNLDWVSTATQYCIFGANDLRGWMYSSGLSV